MAKRLQSTREIELLQHLNASPLRLDPWNPSAPLISIVNADDDDEPLAVFEPLVAYDAQPLATVEEALDFFMQLLQGLVFLQENKIVHGDIHAGVVMMDPAGCPAEGVRVNRVQSNIRYHLVDFTHASIVQQPDDQLFGEDLRDLGLLIEKGFGTVCLFSYLPNGNHSLMPFPEGARVVDYSCGDDDFPHKLAYNGGSYSG